MKRSEFLKSGSSLLAAGLLPVTPVTEVKKPSIRLAFLTDIHVKPDAVAETGMARAFHHVQRSKLKIDFIINGGDSIMDALAADKAKTNAQWDLFNNILRNENSLPVYHCIGNHDIWGWFTKENKPETDPLYGKAWALQALKMEKRYYRFLIGNWHFIVLDSTQLNPQGGYIARIDEEQWSWLEKELQEIPKDHFVCMVSHIPILSICAGLFFNKTEPNGDLKIQRNLMHSDFLRLKQLFLQYPNIKTCLSGHIHLQDELDYLGIKYYCNGAVSGNWWKGRFQEFGPAYALIELFDDGTSKRTMVNYEQKEIR